MSSESVFLLSVREIGTYAARSYALILVLDGQTLDYQSLTPVESQEIRELSSQYQMLLNQKGGAKKTDYLELLGSGLFRLFFEKAWGRIKLEASDSEIRLVVASDIPEILRLPWEIVKPLDEDIFGYNPRMSILRLPGSPETLQKHRGQLPSGPLRLVFAACSPKQSFDYRMEEESLIKSLYGLDVALDSCDLGTYEELKERVERWRPQIVHLVGNAVAKDGQQCFAFETESGLADLKSAKDILKALPGVQLAFISCRDKNQINLENLGIELMKAGLPLAMIWSASIATESYAFRGFYKDLASGNSLYDAISSIRQKIADASKEDVDLLAFPALFSCTNQDRIFDPGQRSVLPEPLIIGQMPLKNTTEGYSENFVGRRRDLQRLVPALSEGIAKTLILTGPDGCGKSTLAAMLAKRLDAIGFTVLVISSSREVPLSASRLIDFLVSEFYEAAEKRKYLGRMDLADGIMAAIHELKNSKDYSNDKRLEKAVGALNTSQFLLVLDGFESNLDEGRSIEDPEIARFYLLLLKDLKSSRAIITSEHLPRNAMTLPKGAWEYALQGLARADFIRFLQRDGDVAARIRSGELNYQILGKIHERTNGLPQCMDRIAKVLKTETPSDLIEESLSSPQNSSSLCDDITSMLFESLDAKSQRVLSRAAVYALPINLAGIEHVTGEPKKRMKVIADEWNQKSLSFRTKIGNDMDGISIQKGMREWLNPRLSIVEKRKAHEAAGDFYLKSLPDKSYNELGITSLECTLEARSHFLAAGIDEKAQDATNRISSTLMARGFYNDIIKLNQELLVRFEHPMPMRWIALAFQEQGDFQNALKWYEKCLDSPARSNEDEAASWHGIAAIELRKGRYEKAEEYLQKALDIYRLDGNEKGVAEILQDLASTNIAKGDYSRAKGNLNKVLEIQRKTDDLAAQADALRGLITIDLRQNDRVAASEKLKDALEIFRRLGQPSSEATTLYDLASLDMERGDYDLAADKFQKSLEIRRRIGDRVGEAAILHSLAMIDAQRELVQEAGEKFKAALKIYQEIGDKPGEAAAFFQLGILGVLHSRKTFGMNLLALSGIILRSIGSDEVRNVDPVIERMAANMKYTQDQFAQMVRVAAVAYRNDMGWTLVEATLRK